MLIKKVLKTFVRLWLKLSVKLFLWRHHPDIIAVSGTTNKYTVKEEIFNSLKDKYKVRTSPRNFNAEIGLPLSILNLPVGYNSIMRWSVILLKALAKPFLSRDIPQIIVLELAIDKPKDMDYLLTLIRPKIAIITNVLEQHEESFETLDDIAHEYLKLAKATTSKGLILLNGDDPRLAEVKDIKAKLWYYGLREGCHFQALDISENDQGVEFTVKYIDGEKTIKINKFGRHHIYAKLAAIAVQKYYAP